MFYPFYRHIVNGLSFLRFGPIRQIRHTLVQVCLLSYLVAYANSANTLSCTNIHNTVWNVAWLIFFKCFLHDGDIPRFYIVPHKDIYENGIFWRGFYRFPSLSVSWKNIVRIQHGYRVNLKGDFNYVSRKKFRPNRTYILKKIVHIQKSIRSGYLGYIFVTFRKAFNEFLCLIFSIFSCFSFRERWYLPGKIRKDTKNLFLKLAN